ncbi:hypothetical protein BIW11_08139, partial [Tropilaelaps mercedesae]
LKEQRAAIQERNLLIKELTERLRATASEQNDLLKSEREHVKGLKMELEALKKKPTEANNNNSFVEKSSSEYSQVESRLAEAEVTVKQQRTQLECERKHSAALQQQVRSLQGQLREISQDSQSWRSQVSEAETRVRILEDRNRSLEGELSEVKTQLIWASEEHEQVRVKLQTRESELKRIEQDLHLRTESLAEATRRLDALRRYETESSAIHRSLQQLKEELNQSMSLTRSLREERDQLQAQLASTGGCNRYANDTISEQTQYLDLPEASFTEVATRTLPKEMRDDVNELLAGWPECGVIKQVESVNDLVTALRSMREYVLHGKEQLEEELHDVLKEGQRVQNLHDVIGIVQVLKAYGLQGRRVPALEEEICTLKVNLADCEARLAQSDKEVERLRAAESRQPFVEEMQRVREEAEAAMAQKLYALQSENLQLQHKNSLLEGQMANHLNCSPSATPSSINGARSEDTTITNTLSVPTTPSTRNLLLFDSTPSRENLTNLNTPPRCLLDMTNVTSRGEGYEAGGQSSLLTETNSSFLLALEESRESTDNLQVEKCNLIRQLNEQLQDEKAKESFKKLMDICSKLHQLEKLVLCNEFTEKTIFCQKKVKETVEQKYLAQIESLAAKWECEKNSALHDQLLRYLHDLSEPMTVHDHIIAIRALLEKELLDTRFQFSCKLKAERDTSVAMREEPDYNEADGYRARRNSSTDTALLYDQLCDTIEKNRLNFEDLCNALTREVNAAKDAFVLKDDNRIKELQSARDETKNRLIIMEKQLGELDKKRELLIAQLDLANQEKSELLQEVEKLKAAATTSTKSDHLLAILEELKKILGVECKDEQLPAILEDMLAVPEVLGGLSLADLSKALRSGADLAEEVKKALIMRLNDSQISLDASTTSGVSTISSAEDELTKLRKEYDVLQRRLQRVEDERNHLESASMISDLDRSCDVKLSDSLIKLVGELRQERNKNKELQQKLDESIAQGEDGSPQKANKCALQSNERLLSILSDVVKTCVSCDQDIVRALEAVGTVEVSGGSRGAVKERDHELETLGAATQTQVEKSAEDEEPLFSLGSALNASRDEGMNGPYPSKEELNELLIEDVLELPLASLQEGGADPQDDMVLVPSRRLRASVAQMVDFVKNSHAHWTTKIRELEERLAHSEEELKDEENVRKDIWNQFAQAKEKVIAVEDTRDRLAAELLALSGQTHNIEHALEESEAARTHLEERLEEAMHMGRVEQRQRKILEAAAAGVQVPDETGSGKDRANDDDNVNGSIGLAINRKNSYVLL